MSNNYQNYLTCCKEFRNALEDSIIIFQEDHYIIKHSYWVNDGDYHYDDMGSEMDINFCPFCGTKLLILKPT